MKHLSNLVKNVKNADLTNHCAVEGIEPTPRVSAGLLQTCRKDRNEILNGAICVVACRDNKIKLNLSRLDF